MTERADIVVSDETEDLVGTLLPEVYEQIEIVERSVGSRSPRMSRDPFESQINSAAVVLAESLQKSAP